MAIYCGIDLGTTNTLITCFDEEGAMPLDINGNRFLPSCIFVKDGSVFVGDVAKNRRKLDASRYIASSKRYMPDKKKWEIDDVKWSPEDVATEILKKAVMCIREKYGPDEEICATVTVPAIFSSGACLATKNAATRAGLNCKSILSEPIAAAYAYSYDTPNIRTLVVDIGGGTFDVALVDASFNTSLVDPDSEVKLKIEGDDKLGGDDFDRAIYENFIKPKINNISNEMEIELLDIARDIKEQLQETTINTTTVTKNLSDGQILDVTVTKAEYMDACNQLQAKMARVLYRLINQSDTDFDKVLLVGGMAKDPNVIAVVNNIPALASKFDGFPPEEYMSLISIGAAWHCWEVTHGGRGVAESVTYTDIGIAAELDDGVIGFSPIIKSGTIISANQPATGCHVYTNSRDNMEKIDILILESKGATALEECQRYQQYELKIPPQPKGTYSVEIRMTLDVNRILTVTDDQNRLLETIEL